VAAQFERVEMRVGRILAAEPFPDARKPAYRLRIDFGPQVGARATSAQLTVTYPERAALVGRQVVAVINFPPRRIAGFESEVLVLGAMRPDGAVVAMVGGRDYDESEFNRAVSALRQPGSAFKLFTYYAALMAGVSLDDRIVDAPVDIDGERLGAPITRPGAVLCIGLNYVAHAAESGVDTPEHPVLFGAALTNIGVGQLRGVPGRGLISVRVHANGNEGCDLNTPPTDLPHEVSEDGITGDHLKGSRARGRGRACR
jgi:tRNA-binding protein